MGKSERLKKLEHELQDLVQWLKLGLVPKKDIEKHQEEIHQLEKRISEEKDRLQAMKESGDPDDFLAMRRQGRTGVYQEHHSLPGMESVDESMGGIENDLESEVYTEVDAELEDNTDFPTETNASQGLEEDPFSDKNRWRRGMLENPDYDEW